MNDLDPILWRVLRKLDENQVLEDGEILCEHEFAILDTDSGGLILTDRRLLFVSTTMLGRSTRVISYPLRAIVDVGSAAHRWLWRRFGTLDITHVMDGEMESTHFERIPGGAERADQIAKSLLRQKRFLI